MSKLGFLLGETIEPDDGLGVDVSHVFLSSLDIVDRARSLPEDAAIVCRLLTIDGRLEQRGIRSVTVRGWNDMAQEVTMATEGPWPGGVQRVGVIRNLENVGRPLPVSVELNDRETLRVIDAVPHPEVPSLLLVLG